MNFLRLTPPWRTFLVYAGVFLLAAGALGLSAVRVLLLFAENYRGETEAYVSTFLGQPVRIGAMDARLLVLSPTLVLHDVSLLDGVTRQPIARFREIRLGLAPLASLKRFAPVSDEITVVGASLEVERRKDGSFHIAGLAMPQNESSDPEAVGRWIFAQHRLALRDARLSWRDQRTERQFEFNGVSLELRNSGERHQLSGSLSLPVQWGGRSTVAVDMRGDPLTAGGAHGKIYVKADRLRPAGILRELPVQGIHARDGNLSVELWGEWDGFELQGVEGDFQGDRLQFAGPDHNFRLAHLSGRMKWVREARGWRWDVADLVLVRGGRTWEPARIRVDLEKSDADPEARHYRVQASFLRIEDIAAVLALVPAGKDWRTQLAALSPRGDLRQVHVDFSTPGEVVAGAEFADLGVNVPGKGPILAGMDGYMYYDNGEVALHLSTHDGTLAFPRIFREPLAVGSLSGDAWLRRDQGGWRLSAPAIEVANTDIHAQLNFRMRLPDTGSPFLDLEGTFQDGWATSTHRYLPVSIMPASAVTWLDSAFKEGEVASGAILFYGRTADFPFDGHQGRFEVRFDARDVALDYHPGWPQLTKINGEVVFDGRSMEVHADSAQLMGSHVSATTVAIPDLLHSRLSVQGHVDGMLPDLFSYLSVTGLAGSFSRSLDDFRAGGTYGLDLSFEQPLGDGPKGSVKGLLSFRDSRLAPAQGVEFTNVNGLLQFEDSRYTAKNIQASIFGEPATIDVAPAGAGDDEQTRVAVKGAVGAAALRKLTSSPLLNRIHGRTSFRGELLLAHSDAQESILRLQSRLEGMAFAFPSPLDKPASESRALELQMWLSGPHAGEVDVMLEHRFAAAMAFKPGGGLARAAVNFGDVLPPVPSEVQIRVTGRLLAFSPAEWKDVFDAAPPGRNTRANVREKPLPVVLDMNELGIVSTPGGATGSHDDVTPDSIPVLTVHIERLDYNKLFLGALSFHTTDSESQVGLRDLTLVNPAYNLTADGEWRTGPEQGVRVNLKASGNDIGAAARALTVASVVSKGDFRFEGQIAWPGGPGDIDPSRIEGTLKVRMEDGVLEDVSPGAGRLLGLLSLQALPQRLMLDFRDIFDSGMRFRTLDGSFTLKDGNAITDNLRMNALPAAVFVKGRTGFVKRDFDQVITVVPDVSGSFPVAGGLVLGPQVGAALLLLQQLFHKDIDNAAKFTYVVKGSWDQPSIKRVN